MTAQVHPARLLHDPLPVVFTAHSAVTAFMKHHICRFVLEMDRAPVNPFMSFEYFMLDTVPRDTVRRANNSLLRAADELWTFGIIADGVYEEVLLARKLGTPVRHFSLGKDLDSIREIDAGELEYEEGVARIDGMTQ